MTQDIKNNIEKFTLPFQSFISESKYIPWLLLIGIASLFIILLSPNNEPRLKNYNLGDVAEKDIKAPIEFLIEDKEATQSNRKLAAEQVLTVYDYDPKLSSRLNQQITKAFADIQDIFEAQKTIKNDEEKKLPSPLNPVPAPKDNNNPKPAENLSPIQIEPPIFPSVHEQILQLKETFEKRIGISISNGVYKFLEKEEFSNEILSPLVNILTEILENGVVSNKEMLLKEVDKGIILRDVETQIENIIFNLKRYYSIEQAKTMVRVIGQPVLKNLHYNMVNLIVDFVQRMIQPNITLNLNETEERRKNASSEVKPVFYKIKKGEMLLREGERVTEVQLLKLKSFQSQIKDERNLASNIGATILFLCLLFTIFYIHILHQPAITYDLNRNLIFIFCVFAIFLTIVKIPIPSSEPISKVFFVGIPIAASPMIICLFMGMKMAVPFAVIISASVSIVLNGRLEIFLFFLISGLMGAYWIQNCRERKTFIIAGLKLSLLNIVLVSAIDIYLSDFSGLKFLVDWGLSFIGGISAGVITAGIAPLVEIAFDYTTDIKLLELANLDCPILRRLMIEAPGTYHHSVIVGSMVEAAASEIGANPLMAKVCGYYHDIGKLKQPLYFIENQSAGKNKHDKLAPSMSSLILIAHVKNGVEIANENKLGKVIADAIRQHHGTSLIRYFYEKAKQRKGEDAVNINDFRYPGPKPQTREAGIVMLADVVDAASRTLDNPTPARIQGLVQNLINNIFSDGQLNDCELTLKDLHNIAKCFNKILNGIHHHRIEYDKSTSNSGKNKDAHSDKQQTKQTSDSSGQNSDKSSGHLKRLGIS